MILLKTNLKVAVKVLVAVVLLSGLAGVAGSQLAPEIPLQTVLYYCAIGAAILLAFLVISLVVSLTFSQFILRKGGTDAAWFWFKKEPQGLERQRAQLKTQKE